MHTLSREEKEELLELKELMDVIVDYYGDLSRARRERDPRAALAMREARDLATLLRDYDMDLTEKRR